MTEEITEEWFAYDLPEELTARGMDGLVEVIARGAKPFFAQGSDHVVVARHCGNLFIGKMLPEHCGTCGEKDPGELRIVYVRPEEAGPHGILLSREEPS